MLYRIEGTGVKIVGTAPALTMDAPGLPPWLQSVFDRADRCVFATDIETIDPVSELLPSNQSLSVLSFFDLVNTQWQRLQIPGRPARLKAWAAGDHLGKHLSGLLAPGVEALLLPEARQQRPPPLFLESSGEWLAARDAVPLDEQLARLEHLVTRPEEAAAFDVAVHAAWRAQNIDTIGRLLDSQRKVYPATFSRLLDERHERWLPVLAGNVHNDAAAGRSLNTLVAVGALHLCGEQGVIALLAREGFTATRLL